jgi:hypothetical protein
MSRFLEWFQSDASTQGSGVTTLDLADLPSPLPRLMRLMLRRVEMTRAEISAEISQFPEADRLTDEELDEALSGLILHGWIARNDEQSEPLYRVNLRRKLTAAAAAAAPRRRAGALAQGIWESLGVPNDDAARSQSDTSQP